MHINEVIKKGNRLIGYIKSIIDGQDDFKRVYYGDLLWKSLGLSSITYGSAVWVPSDSDVKRIEHLQNQMARCILKASRNTPIDCLLGELGWEPINVVQDKLRIKYFNRLRCMSSHGWPKLLYNATTMIHEITDNKKRRWISYMRKVFVDCGMDFIFENTLYNHQWTRNCINISTSNYQNKWLNSVLSKSFLSDYVLLKSKPELEQYLLCNLDFHAASLKFKARSNTLPINGRTYSWNPDKDSVCPLCKEGTEDLRNVWFICRTLRDIRVTEYHKLEYELVTNNLNQIWHLFISSNLNVKLCLMLGISKEIIPENYSDTCWPTDINYILCIFDSFCKSFLKKACNLRADFRK